MSDLIQRYKEGDPDAGMFPSEDGYYVEYQDHQAEIARLTALLKYSRRPGKSNLAYIHRIAKLEAAIEYFITHEVGDSYLEAALEEDKK